VERPYRDDKVHDEVRDWVREVRADLKANGVLSADVKDRSGFGLATALDVEKVFAACDDDEALATLLIVFAGHFGPAVGRVLPIVVRAS
jgi:hypothetical protein